MRKPVALVLVTSAVLLGPAVARAEPPPGQADPVLAGIVGAATAFAGFAVGGTLMGVTGDNSAANMAGWLTMEGGFALAPFTAHAMVGEWWRGVAFSALPTAATLGTVPVFLYNEGAVLHGSLPQQRWMYGFIVGDILASGVGVVDAVLAPRRGLYVSPTVVAGGAGLTVGGVL
jgi:hypothetical protein